MTRYATVFYGKQTSGSEFECCQEFLMPLEAIVLVGLYGHQPENYPVELSNEYDAWFGDEGNGEAVFITAGELRRIHPFNIDGQPQAR